MAKRKSTDNANIVSVLEGLLEIALFTTAYYWVWRVMYDESNFPPFMGNGKYVLMGVYAVLVLVLFYFNEGFAFGYLKSSDVISSQWVAIFIADFITYLQLCLIANRMVTPVPILLVLVAEMIFSAIYVAVITKLYRQFHAPQKMLMIYGKEKSAVLKLKMDLRSDKYHIDKIVSADLGFDRITSKIPFYDAVVICDVPAELRNDILKYCYTNDVRTYLTPKLSDIIIKASGNIHLFDTPLMYVKASGLTLGQRFVKRTMDIILSLIALIVLSPFMLIIALAIKLEDGGPVFYRQRRVTRNGRIFNILKFRSMIVDAEKEGKSIPATDNDPRITKVGKFIRAIRADELAQIFNILKNDMSIVGPRPERTEHVQKYTSYIPEFGFRNKVKGGLTGYAQVFGKYNTTPYDKLMLDMMYIENYSLLLDLKIILTTVKVLFKKESTEGFDKSEIMFEDENENPVKDFAFMDVNE